MSGGTRFESKTVLVTGAGSGIGLATVDRLLAEGANVCGLDLSEPKRDEIPLGFRVDNIHWARDGSLYATGQAQQGWKAVKIDPTTLAVRDVVARADTAEFSAGTAVVEVGDSLWVGSFRGNRIAIIPAP